METLTIKFFIGDQLHSFNVKHNFPQVQGLDIRAAADNWLARTNDYTVESFCEYVNSKRTGYTCRPSKKID